eukprot:scaffold131539_cov43-Cyclotella_meneghiniana.AAC.3
MEYFACKGLLRLDFDCWEGEKFSCGLWPLLKMAEVKSSVVAPTEEGRASDREDLFILTIAAGLSQCVSVVSILIAGRVKSSVVVPIEECRVSDHDDLFILTIAAGLSQCLIVDILNDVMRSGLECFVFVAPTEEGQVSHHEDLFILTIAAGLSQCLIVDILNDVMRSGLECFACKGLHRLDFDCWEGEKFSCGPY